MGQPDLASDSATVAEKPPTKRLRKIINEPADFVDEVVDGIVRAHPGDYRFAGADRRAVIRADSPQPGRVGIVTGGGSGHLPLFLGYVGRGLASGVAVGNVFSSPSPQQILSATRAVDAGAGVLYVYGNYGGDIYNFDMAGELARAEGISVATVLGHDDVLSAPAEAAATRRGIADLVFAFKIAGAAAERGDGLASVTELAQAAADATCTAGVGLAPTILPAAGAPTFTLAEGEMEIGVGIHGESGVATVPIASAREIARELYERCSGEAGVGPGARLAVLVNGLGATPLEELYLLYAHVAGLVEGDGAVVAMNFIGEYATSLEMAGASISLLRLSAETEDLLAAPAASPFWRPGTRVETDPTRVSAIESGGPTGTGYPTAGFVSDVGPAVRALAGALPGHVDELNRLDARLGDGDLGVTVGAGIAAMAKRLDELPEKIVSSALLRELGTAFASANPSTFAALVGFGLIAASTEIDDSQPLGRIGALRLGRRISASIAERGGAALGDKTLLDVLVPALDVLETNPGSADFRAFVDRQLDEVAALRSARGRAAWHQERSIGQHDPGAVATALVLRELLAAHGARA